MKNPLTEEAFERFTNLKEGLCYELRSRRRMRYGRTINLIESMLDLMIWDRSWERRKDVE